MSNQICLMKENQTVPCQGLSAKETKTSLMGEIRHDIKQIKDPVVREKLNQAFEAAAEGRGNRLPDTDKAMKQVAHVVDARKAKYPDHLASKIYDLALSRSPKTLPPTGGVAPDPEPQGVSEGPGTGYSAVSPGLKAITGGGQSSSKQAVGSLTPLKAPQEKIDLNKFKNLPMGGVDAKNLSPDVQRAILAGEPGEAADTVMAEAKKKSAILPPSKRAVYLSKAEKTAEAVRVAAGEIVERRELEENLRNVR